MSWLKYFLAEWLLTKLYVLCKGSAYICGREINSHKLLLKRSGTLHTQGRHIENLHEDVWYQNIFFGQNDSFVTPGNVVRGNQKLWKGNPYGSTRPWLTASEKCKQTGRCSHFLNLLTLLQLDFGKSSNVGLNNFLFCTKPERYGHGKTSGGFLI